MLSHDSIRPHLKLSCPCGADVRVDPLDQKRGLSCPKCGLSINFVVSVDPLDRKRSKVSLIVPLNAVDGVGESLGTIIRKSPMAPKKPSKTVSVRSVTRKSAIPPARASSPPVPPPSPRPAGRPAKGVLAECPCGSAFPVDESDLASLQYCPGCGIRYHIVVKLEHGTRNKTALLVPAKVMGQRDGRSVPPPKPAAPSRKTVGVTKVRRTAATELIPGVQSVPCLCGATLAVRRRDVQHGMSCPACRRSLAFSEVRDPQTLAPLIRVREVPS